MTEPNRGQTPLERSPTSKRRSLLLRAVATLFILLLTLVTGLAVLVVLMPARLFGVSRNNLEYSLFRHLGDADCVRLRASRWRCEVFDAQSSGTYRYRVVVSDEGCWRATSKIGSPERGCVGFRDYVRLLDR